MELKTRGSATKRGDARGEWEVYRSEVPTHSTPIANTFFFPEKQKSGEGGEKSARRR